MRDSTEGTRGLRVGRRVIPPLTVVLGLTVLGVFLNWLQKYPCHGGDFGNGRALRYYCYTDVIALHSGHGLGEGRIPYVQHPVEYPVLTGALEAAVGLPVHWLADRGVLRSLWGAFGFAEPGQGTVYYDIVTLVLIACAMATTYAIVRMRPGRPYDAVMFALAPGVLISATVNFDLLAVGLMMLGILAWSQQRPGLSGVLIGLAACAKFFPFLLLGPLILLCLRKRTAAAVYSGLTTLGATVATWVAVNLPVALIAPDGWWTFYRFSSERGVDWGSFWYIGDHVPLREGPLDRFFGHLVGDVELLNVLAWLFFAVCCLGIAVLIRLAPVPPRFGSMAFLVVAAFLLTNKVWSQQFVLWLIPLVVLARPRWGLFLVWQASEVLYFLSFYQVQLNGGAVEFALIQAAVLRWLTVALICGHVVVETLRPERDVVRRDGVVDPEGGVLVDPPPGPDRVVAGDVDAGGIRTGDRDAHEAGVADDAAGAGTEPAPATR